MSDIRTILNTIQSSIDGFTGDVGAKQQTLFKQIISLTKGLETNGDVLLNTVNNLKIINQLKVKIEKLIIDPKYKSQLKQFVQSYNDIAQLHNDYFANIAGNVSASKALDVLKKTAIETTLNSLTETGIDAYVTGPLKKILLANTQAGGSYADMIGQLRGYMLGKDGNEGALEQYIRTYGTTAINQFSAEYNKSIADDLGLEWYVYTGSLLTTSRPFCIKAVDKKYIHASEFQTLLDGDFGALGKVHLNKKTGLPDGMMDGTDPENFPRRRGGWNCGHQLIAVATMIVPMNIQDAVYRTNAYKSWAIANNKEIKEPAAIQNLQTNYVDQFKDSIQHNLTSASYQEIRSASGLSQTEILNLTGGIPASTITNIRQSIFHHEDTGVIDSTVETDQYRIGRDINYEDKTIYNAIMKVKNTGSGIGLNLFVNQVSQARELGFEYMDVSAAGDFRTLDDWNGYITWAKFGYEMKQGSQQQFAALMKEYDRKETNVFELVSTKEGLDFWTKKGFGWNGRFDFSDDSQSMKNLRKYLADRNINVEL